MKTTSTWENREVSTKNAKGEYNGRVITVWSLLARPIAQPRQIYVTTVLPGESKGPHLHNHKDGLFCCVKGNVKIVTRGTEGEYHEDQTGEAHSFRLIKVPAGTPALLISESEEEALVLNMPSEVYNPEDELTADFSDYHEKT